jgi:hypothetical protein
MDAIFIQSFHKEFINLNVFNLIERIQKNIKDKNIPIFVFTNMQSLNIKPAKYLHLFDNNNISFLYIDEDYVLNPTSKIFHFLINFETEKYRKVLLLESDCFLTEFFDFKIKEEISQSLNEKDWYIYGSHYYGIKGVKLAMDFVHEDEQVEKNRLHMNGVAVYNRSEQLIDLINDIFINNRLENLKTNYDFALFRSTLDMGIGDKFIDSDLIINISAEEDSSILHNDLKPKAVVIHTKNPHYFTHK